MSSSTPQTLRTVTATGVALAKFDTVKFKVEIETKGKTGQSAEDKARPIIAAVIAAVAKLETSGVRVDRDDLKATTKTDLLKRYDQASGSQKPDGYQCTYTLSFRCPDVDRASEIHHALSAVDGAQAASPDFKLKDLAALHKKALKDAKAKADERFANECEILGLDGSDYALANYKVDYDDSESAGARPMRAAMSMESVQHDAPAGGAAPIEIHAGQAKVKATLSIAYAAKPAPKATRTRAQTKTGNGGSATAPRAATAG
jgi:uncharacterized protein YggE